MKNTGTKMNSMSRTGANMCVGAMLSVTPYLKTPNAVKNSANTKTDLVRPNDMRQFYQKEGA